MILVLHLRLFFQNFSLLSVFSSRSAFQPNFLGDERSFLFKSISGVLFLLSLHRNFLFVFLVCFPWENDNY